MTFSNFIVRPPLLGNQSGNKSPQNLNQQRPEMCTTATQVEVSDTAADTGVGTSDSSSEEDEPPTEEATKRVRELVVYNATKQMVEDPETATAFLQALAKFRFEFQKAKGIKKICGEGFFNVEIPKEAIVKKFKAKKKGTGKKSAPGHISAQERDPEVLELEITKEDNEMLKEPEKATAGPSGQAGEKERGRRKEKVQAPQKSDGNKKRKRRSSPRYRWIKFYHDENTRAAKEAKEDRTSHQLLVHSVQPRLDHKKKH